MFERIGQMLAALAIDPFQDLDVARLVVPFEQIVRVNREAEIVHEGLGTPLDQMVVKPARLVAQPLQPRRPLLRQLARVDLEREGFRPHRFAPLDGRLARGFAGLAVLVLDGFSGGLGHGGGESEKKNGRKGCLVYAMGQAVWQAFSRLFAFFSDSRASLLTALKDGLCARQNLIKPLKVKCPSDGEARRHLAAKRAENQGPSGAPVPPMAAI